MLSRRLLSFSRRVGGVLALLALALTGLVLAMPSPTSAAADPSWRLIELVNSERAYYGLQPLAVNSALMSSAQSYAGVLSGGWCWGHYCDAGPSDRAYWAGYRGSYYVGENIAYGVDTPEAVFRMWMNSYGHRANILSPTWTQIGVGVAWSGDATYWAENFGT